MLFYHVFLNRWLDATLTFPLIQSFFKLKHFHLCDTRLKINKIKHLWPYGCNIKFSFKLEQHLSISSNTKMIFNFPFQARTNAHFTKLTFHILRGTQSENREKNRMILFLLWKWTEQEKDLLQGSHLHKGFPFL